MLLSYGQAFCGRGRGRGLGRWRGHGRGLGRWRGLGRGRGRGRGCGRCRGCTTVEVKGESDDARGTCREGC